MPLFGLIGHYEIGAVCHVRDCFQEQGLVYDPETGDLCMEHGLRAEPSDSDSDAVTELIANTVSTFLRRRRCQ